MEERWPLIGREAELAAGAAAMSDGRGVLVAGPRGSGRSRLAAELAARAGAAAVQVTATSAARTTTLGALAPILDAEGATDLDRARRGLAARTGATRPVLVVDDAHLLDDASAAVVLQLAATGEATVVATTVAGASAPDAVIALWKDGHLVRVDLAPLHRDAMATLVEAALAPVAEGGARHALVAAAGGSPLALQQLVEDAAASGALSFDDGVWRLRGPLARGGRFADVVASRLAGVADVERDVLELVAVAGHVGVAVLERLVSPSLLEALERDGHLVTSADGARVEVRLAPGLDHGVLLGQLSPLKVRQLSRRLADALEATTCRRAGDRVALAGLRLDGGGDVAGDLLLAGALDATRLLDDEAALRLARAAWSRTRRVDAGQLLGRLLWLAGKHEAAEAVLAEAAGDADDDETLVHLSNVRATNLLRGLHDAAGADAVFADARGRVTGVDCRDALEAHQAAVEFLRGDAAAAARRSVPLLDEARPWVFVEAAVSAVPALAVGGRTDEAAALAQRAYAIYSELPPRSFAQDSPAIHLMTLTMALVHGGHLDLAADVARRCYDAALDHRSTTGHAWFALVLGNVAEQRGALRQACAWFVEAADSFDQGGEAGLRRVCLAHVALAAALGGDRAAADSALQGVHALDHTPIRLYDTVADRAEAWVDALDGRGDAAAARLEAAADRDLARGRAGLASTAAHDLARVGAVDRAAALMAQIPELEGRLLPLRRSHVEALAAADAGALEEVGTRFEELGASLYGAEAFAAAARHRADAGEPRAAAALARRATTLAERCEGAATPGLAGVAMVAARLTPREAELARMAARAVNNAEIASRLGLSVRTVENHLARAYAKLGVSGRDELPAALAADGPL